MINRRLIRIKVLQSLFAFNSGSLNTLQEAEKDLEYTFDRIYDLYFVMLSLVIEIHNYHDLAIYKAKNKLLPTHEDLNPNEKFLNNKLIVQLKENLHLQEGLKNRKFSWQKYPELLKELYNVFIQTPEFKEYLNSDDISYTNDKNILNFLVEYVFFNTEFLYSTLEEESIYWIDNVDFVLLSVKITLSKFSIGDDSRKKLLLKFKKLEDLEFAKKLQEKCIKNKEDYINVIERNVINWDFDRISNIDKILLQLAVCELVEFEEIPIKVTLNEYIELAKVYGIPNKSPNFINGILDKITKELKDLNLINKIGRGLKEN